MAGSYIHPDTATYLQRLERSLTVSMLKDQHCNIFAVMDRLSAINFDEIDFAIHCGSPKFLKNENLAPPSTNVSKEGIIGIAGIFHQSCWVKVLNLA